jgi:hypothetical protein
MNDGIDTAAIAHNWLAAAVYGLCANFQKKKQYLRTTTDRKHSLENKAPIAYHHQVVLCLVQGYATPSSKLRTSSLD